MLSEADEDKDGLVTESQWAKVELWFQYKAFVPGTEDDLDGEFTAKATAQSRILTRAESQKVADESSQLLKKMLWEVFSSTITYSSLLDYKAVLLYLCPDRDMFLAIKKAISVAVKSLAANSRADASQVARISYPLGSESGQAIQRMPLDHDAISEIVRTIYESRNNGAAAGDVATVTAEQLIYSVAGERLVTVLLHRYQFKDVFVAASI